jgi:hypothetical protein
LHLPKLAAVGTLGSVSRVRRQGADAQHASGREHNIPAKASEPSLEPTQNLNLNLRLQERASAGRGPSSTSRSDPGTSDDSDLRRQRSPAAIGPAEQRRGVRQTRTELAGMVARRTRPIGNVAQGTTRIRGPREHATGGSVSSQTAPASDERHLHGPGPGSAAVLARAPFTAGGITQVLPLQPVGRLRTPAEQRHGRSAKSLRERLG